MSPPLPPVARFSPIAALALVAILALMALPWPYYPRYDSGAYLSVAESLASGQGYTDSAHPWQPPFVWFPPGFPLLLSLPMALGLKSWAWLKLPAALCALGTLGLMLRLRKGAPLALAAAILMAGLGQLLTYSNRIQAETCLALLIVATVLVAERWKASGFRANRWALATALLAGVAPLIRLQGLALLPALLSFAVMEAPGRRSTGLYRGLLVMVPGLLGLLGWAAFNGGLGLLDPGRSWVFQSNWHDPTAAHFDTATWLLERGKAAFKILFFDVPASFSSHDLRFLDRRPGPALLLLLPLAAVGFVRASLPRHVHAPPDPVAPMAPSSGRSLAEHLLPWMLALLIVLPDRETRYLVPLAPFLALWTVDGALFLAGLAHRPRIRSAALFLLLGIPLANQVLHAARRTQVFDEWGRKTVLAAASADARALVPPGSVLLVHDAYGLHADTGLKTLDYSSNQRAPFGSRLEDYLKAGDRIDAAILFTPHVEGVKAMLARHGYHLVPVGKDGELIALFGVTREPLSSEPSASPDTPADSGQ